MVADVGGDAGKHDDKLVPVSGRGLGASEDGDFLKNTADDASDSHRHSH